MPRYFWYEAPASIAAVKCGLLAKDKDKDKGTENERKNRLRDKRVWDHGARLCQVQKTLGGFFDFNQPNSDPRWNIAYTKLTYELMKTSRYGTRHLCSDGMIHPVSKLTINVVAADTF